MFLGVSAVGYIRVYLGGALQDQFELTRDRLTIGRAADNDLVLNDPGISSHHAVIVRDGNQFILEDNNSTNGVYLNNERIDKSELKYWDEIQIYNHILKFMALSGLKEGADPDVPDEIASTTDKTVILDLSLKRKLSELRMRRKSALINVLHKDGSETGFPITKVLFAIGRSPECDIVTGGWLAPKQAASLEKSSDGYYLVPHWRGRVALNGERLKSRSKLEDGDEFKVRNLSLHFVHRVIDE